MLGVEKVKAWSADVPVPKVRPSKCLFGIGVETVILSHVASSCCPAALGCVCCSELGAVRGTVSQACLLGAKCEGVPQFGGSPIPGGCSKTVLSLPDPLSLDQSRNARWREKKKKI